MTIHYDAERRVFHLQTSRMSYVIGLVHGGHPAHLYWGPRLRKGVWPGMVAFVGTTGFSPKPYPDLSFDVLPQEYSAYGTSDYRHPAYQIKLENGSTITEPTYAEHRIYAGKPKLDGLPATYTESDDEAVTLELMLADETAGLQVVLLYTVFRNHDAIARSARIVNTGGQTLEVLRALSMSVDFRSDRFELLSLPGSWARERDVARRPLANGMQGVESRRGSRRSLRF